MRGLGGVLVIVEKSSRTPRQQRREIRRGCLDHWGVFLDPEPRLDLRVLVVHQNVVVHVAFERQLSQICGAVINTSFTNRVPT